MESVRRAAARSAVVYLCRQEPLSNRQEVELEVAELKIPAAICKRPA